MNWKNEAMERLREYEAKKRAVRCIPEELAALEAASVKLRGAVVDGTPVRGGGSGREDALLNNIVKRQELQENLERTHKWLALTDTALGTLTPEDRQVVERFYIYPERGAAERLVAELGLEVRTVYRRRDEALRQFTIALYGCCES